MGKFVWRCQRCGRVYSNDSSPRLKDSIDEHAAEHQAEDDAA